MAQQLAGAADQMFTAPPPITHSMDELMAAARYLDLRGVNYAQMSQDEILQTARELARSAGP